MSNPITRRVLRSVLEARNHGSMSAGMPKVTIEASDAEILCSQNEQLMARVAELEHREDAMCDLHYANGAKQGFSWGQVSDENALHQCVSARMSAGVSELFELRKAGGDL